MCSGSHSTLDITGKAAVTEGLVLFVSLWSANKKGVSSLNNRKAVDIHLSSYIKMIKCVNGGWTEAYKTKLRMIDWFYTVQVKYMGLVYKVECCVILYKDSFSTLTVWNRGAIQGNSVEPSHRAEDDITYTAPVLSYTTNIPQINWKTVKSGKSAMCFVRTKLKPGSDWAVKENSSGASEGFTKLLVNNQMKANRSVVS